jgi:protein-S-isoprenylcysteine O-methyltransferase Ste14
MNKVNLKAFGGLFFLLVIMAAILFFSAETFRYWQAWLFLSVFGISTLAITLYLMKNDPGLLERRTKAGPVSEKELGQKIIQSLSSLAFILIIVFPAFDHRFGWSPIPTFVSILGDLLVALGLYFVFLVFKVNSFTSATIEVGKEQRVVTTGPYSLVRHPMYAGAFIFLIGIPLALGSLWGLLTIPFLMITIIVRLLDEEKFLSKNLKGYKEYMNKAKYRLVPFIW